MRNQDKEVGMKNPIQPLVTDERGTVRFKENAIVRHLLDSHPKCDMNTLAVMDFSNDDRQQFAQLIGYSLSGYSSLQRYVDDDAYGVAAALLDEGLTEKDARIAYLEHELFMVRSALREPMARLFGVHPDDLGQNIDGDA
jgi:hypothetical protein